MTLGEVIAYLNQYDPDMIWETGIGFPHSYRGDYSQLAFKEKRRVTVEDMLADCKIALETPFMGWKGGEYRFDESTDVYLAERGETGESLTKAHFESWHYEMCGREMQEEIDRLKAEIAKLKKPETPEQNHARRIEVLELQIAALWETVRKLTKEKKR